MPNINNDQYILGDEVYSLNELNNMYIAELLDGLYIIDKNQIQSCVNFFINEHNNLTINEYLNQLIDNLNILKKITDDKINYQIENKYKFTFKDSILNLFLIIQYNLKTMGDIILSQNLEIKKQMNKVSDIFWMDKNIQDECEFTNARLCDYFVC